MKLKVECQASAQPDMNYFRRLNTKNTTLPTALGLSRPKRTRGKPYIKEYAHHAVNVLSSDPIGAIKQKLPARSIHLSAGSRK